MNGCSNRYRPSPTKITMSITYVDPKLAEELVRVSKGETYVVGRDHVDSIVITEELIRIVYDDGRRDKIFVKSETNYKILK